MPRRHEALEDIGADRRGLGTDGRMASDAPRSDLARAMAGHALGLEQRRDLVAIRSHSGVLMPPGLTLRAGVFDRRTRTRCESGECIGQIGLANRSPRGHFDRIFDGATVHRGQGFGF